MHKRNYIQFFILFISSYNCFSQSEKPFYEQIAFDFYKESILKTYPVKRKITIYKSLTYNSEEEIYYIPSNCLKNEISNNEKKIEKLEFSKYWKTFEDMRLNLDLKDINKKQFKIRKNNNGSFPKLYIHYPKIYKNRIFVILHEKKLNNGKYYIIEFNESGEIIDWCLSTYTLIYSH